MHDEVHKVTGDEGEIVYRYLLGVFDDLPTRKQVKKAIASGRILVNGTVASELTRVQNGDEITLRPRKQTHPSFELPIEVVYEDEFLAIVNKPSGLPTSGNMHRTLANALPFNLKPSAYPPRPVHRLDAATSGLVVCSKSADTTHALNALFASKEIEKIYHAIALGIFDEAIRIQHPIDSKQSETDVTPLETSESTPDQTAFSLLKCEPKTGRTHQIRIHLSESGHPILGDKLYGEEIPIRAKGLYLVASKVSFIHPFTQEQINCEIPLPNKFKTFIRRYIRG